MGVINLITFALPDKSACGRALGRVSTVEPGISPHNQLDTNLTTALQKCAVVPRRAHIQDSWTFVSLNSMLERHKEQRRNLGECVCAGSVARVGGAKPGIFKRPGHFPAMRIDFVRGSFTLV